MREERRKEKKYSTEEKGARMHLCRQLVNCTPELFF